MQTLVTNAGTYIFIKFFSQGLVFLTTIALSLMLGLQDFAVIGIHLIITAFLLPLVNLNLHHSIERFFFLYRDEEERAQKIFTISLVSFILTILIALTAFVILSYVFQLNFYRHEFLVITLLSFVLQSTHHIPLVIMRCEQKIVEYGIYSLLTVLLTQLLVLWFTYFEGSIEGFFSGTLSGSVITFFIWGFWLNKKFSYRLMTMKAEIKYILPNLPLGLLESVQQTFDRFFMQHFVSDADFASYSMAQRVSGPIKTVAAGAKSVTNPILYSLKKEEDVKSFLSDYTILSIAIFGIIVHLMILVMAVIFEFVLKPEYKVIFPIFLICLLGYFFKAQEVFMAVGADIKMQLVKNLKLLTPIILIQILTASLLIYFFGVWGGAIAFAINCGYRLGALSVLGQKLVPRDLHFSRYCFLLLISILPIGVYLLTSIAFHRIFGLEMALSLFSLGLLLWIIWRELSAASDRPK